MMQEAWPEMEKMIKNQPRNDENLKPVFQLIANNVAKHKKRLGGHFAIAQAVPSRYLRDCIKEVLGPDCICVVLRLSKETNAKRVEARHGGGDKEVAQKTIDFLNGIYEIYEDAQPDEEHCVTVHIGPEDTREDVANNILKKVEDFGFNIEI